jgi:hypothetical protein
MTQPLSREIDTVHAAVLFVDVQNYNWLRERGEYARCALLRRTSDTATSFAP